MIEGARKLKGTLRYDVYQDVKEAGSLVLIETYASKEDFEAHTKAEYFGACMGEIKQWSTA